MQRIHTPNSQSEIIKSEQPPTCIVEVLFVRLCIVLLGALPPRLPPPAPPPTPGGPTGSRPPNQKHSTCYGRGGGAGPGGTQCKACIETLEWLKVGVQVTELCRRTQPVVDRLTLTGCDSILCMTWRLARSSHGRHCSSTGVQHTPPPAANLAHALSASSTPYHPHHPHHPHTHHHPPRPTPPHNAAAKGGRKPQQI